MHEEIAAIKPGHQVYAGGTEIGEIVREIPSGDVVYLHVRRFGPGEDDLYIPTIAIRQVVGGHVYLNLTAEELVSQPWHVPPGGRA